MRRFKRGVPVRCTLAGAPLHGVIYDQQLPRERQHGLVYIRVTADCALARRGQRMHVPVSCVARRTPGAHAARQRPTGWNRLRFWPVLGKPLVNA